MPPRPLAVPQSTDTDWGSWLRAVVNWIRQLEIWRQSGDPFDQYALKVDALAVFSFAAYLRMRMTAPTAFADLGLAWQTLTVFDVADISRGITGDPVANTFTFDYDGVYMLHLAGSFEHNSSNSGRTTNIRLYNVDDSVVIGNAFPIGIGRNVEDSTIPIALLTEISDATKNKAIRIEIGGGSTVTSVQFNALALSIHAVSEWRESFAGTALAQIGQLTDEGGIILTDEGGLPLESD